MTDKRKVNLKVGITVVISILILLYGIAFLKEFKIAINENDYVVYFKDVINLKEGDPVSVSGFQKGKIKKIEIEGDSVKVMFSLVKDIVLKKDYEIKVTMIELMSGKQVSVYPGRSDTLADITKPLHGEKGWDVIGVLSSLGDVSERAKLVLARLDTVMVEVNETVKGITDVVNDESFRSNIRSTASNFNLAAQNLNSVVQENRQSLNILTGKLHSIADNLDQTITETKPELKETIGDIRDLASRMDTLAMNFNQIALNAQDSTNSVGKLLSGDEFYQNLNKTVININKLVQKINKKGIRLRLF
jgi:phospholipid/cholesterol/gamma-HCH transport system substrate-binding protein